MKWLQIGKKDRENYKEEKQQRSNKDLCKKKKREWMI